MLERTDAITNEVLEQITFVLAYPTVRDLGFSEQFWDVTHCCFKQTVPVCWMYLEDEHRRLSHKTDI